MARLDSKIIEFDISNHISKILDVESFEIDQHDLNKIYWIHCNQNNKKFLNELSTKLTLPAELIKLCEENDAIPKIHEMNESLTLRIQCLSSEINADFSAKSENLIIHLTPHYCFTIATGSIHALQVFIDNYMKDLKYAATSCFILFLILDNVINDFSNRLFNFESLADEMEFGMRADHKNLYSEVMDTKNKLMKIKRYAAAIRDILMRISGRKIIVISDKCHQSLKNLFNHSQMIVVEADAIRDILNSTLDQIDNSLMQKMSESMKVLTAFSAIFLPLTLIAGIYGMNFHWIPELNWKYGYFLALFLMLCVGGMLFFFFKKKKWF